MSELTMNQYQELAHTTAFYPKEHAVSYTILGLVGEAGELANKHKKFLRGDKNTASKEDMASELGDVLWYVAMLAKEFGLTLNEVAQSNVDKLRSRSQRGVIKGTGDNR